MKHAGVAITITTITDLVAFAIGAFSKVYFVRCVCVWSNCVQSRFNFVCRNFCLFAISSLSFVYLYICTFFLAALAIDQMRVDAGRWRLQLSWWQGHVGLSTQWWLLTQPLFQWSKAKGNGLEEGSARVSWYETQLLIGQPNGCSPKSFFSQIIR